MREYYIRLASFVLHKGEYQKKNYLDTCSHWNTIKATPDLPILGLLIPSLWVCQLGVSESANSWVYWLLSLITPQSANSPVCRSEFADFQVCWLPGSPILQTPDLRVCQPSGCQLQVCRLISLMQGLPTPSLLTLSLPIPLSSDSQRLRSPSLLTPGLGVCQLGVCRLQVFRLYADSKSSDYSVWLKVCWLPVCWLWVCLL